VDTTRQRRSGPGGQHRNKVETAIRLHHEPTGVRVIASKRRSLVENRERGFSDLRLKLALEVRSAAATLPRWGGDESVQPPSPSELWKSRLKKGGKLSVSPSHDDFPALLAEALDVIAREGWDVKWAAKAQGLTTSQLIKLVDQAQGALRKVNDERTKAGLRPLKP